jgi:hypothetical protein
MIMPNMAITSLVRDKEEREREKIYIKNKRIKRWSNEYY